MAWRNLQQMINVEHGTKFLIYLRLVSTLPLAFLIVAHGSAGSSAALITMAPIVQHGSVEFAPLGLTNMLNGGGSIMDLKPQSPGNGAGSISMEVRGTGEFIAYCSQQPKAVLGGDKGMQALDFEHEPASCRLLIQLPFEGPLDQTVSLNF